MTSKRTSLPLYILLYGFRSSTVGKSWSDTGDGGLIWSASEFPEEAVVTTNIFNIGERFYLKDDGRNTLWVSDNGESWQAYELRYPLRGLARKDDTLFLLGEGNHILKVQMQ